MTMRYSGHLVRTRQQAAWFSVALFVLLLPLVGFRFTTERPSVALGLSMLALAPFVLAYQSWRFLEAQERVHSEPTPEMAFVFRFLANSPLTFSALLFVVLIGID